MGESIAFFGIGSSIAGAGEALYWVRARLVSRRMATINQILPFLIEHGTAVRTGANSLRRSHFAILEIRADEQSPRMSDLIVGLYEDWLWHRFVFGRRRLP